MKSRRVRRSWREGNGPGEGELGEKNGCVENLGPRESRGKRREDEGT